LLSTGPLVGLPTCVRRPLGVGADVVTERRLNRGVPHQLLQSGGHDPRRPALPKGPPERGIVVTSVRSLARELMTEADDEALVAEIREQLVT